MLGLDIGTSCCKAAVYAADGRSLSSASRSYPTDRPRAGEASIDSRAIAAALRAVVAEAASAARASAGVSVDCVSVSSMGEAFVPLAADGSILAPSVLSVDVRGGEYLSLFDRFSRKDLFRITPNVPGISYSFPKLRWLKDHQKDIYDRTWKFLFWADYAVYLLCGEAVACYSLANRAMLFDFPRERWSAELLEAAGLDESKLGRPVPAGTVAGTALPAVAAELGLAPGCRIVVGGHDQCLAALGSGAVRGGSAACGIGTIECITPVMDAVPDLDTLRELSINIEHHVVPGKYVSFIYNQAGSLQKWYARAFASAECAAAGCADGDGALYEALCAEMPGEPSGLLVLPFFEPTGAPLFMSDHSGCILGLTTSTTRGQVLKGVLEGVALYFADSLATLQEVGCPADRFIASGGGARSDSWLQLQADVFGRPFERAPHTEAGTLGAALLAGASTGVFASFDEAVAAFASPGRVFEPDAARHRRYRELLEQYRTLWPLLRGRVVPQNTTE